jgi:hypothetical protein
MSVTGRLENWSIDPRVNVVWGNCYDDVHKRWRNGTRIHTSLVLTAKVCIVEGAIISTLNSTYLLGKPSA